MNIEQALIKTAGFGVKEFIDKSVEGGYPKEKTNNYLHSNRTILESSYSIILDPKAWEAVGRAEEWRELIGVFYMRRFIDALVDDNKE